MLPEAKLDILLARHATLEAELMRPGRRRDLCEGDARTGRADAGRRGREGLSCGAGARLTDIDALIADPATDTEMRALAEAERPALEAAAHRARARDPRRAVAEGRDGRAQRGARNPRRHRRRRSLAVRRRPVPHVRALRRAAGLEGRGHLGQRGHGGRLQGDHRRDRRPRRLRAAEVRIRRAPRAARARHRDAGRIHTSAATVAVLPEAEDVDIDDQGQPT